MIQQVTIRNFKSIGEVTVDLSPVTVLIGRSGVGKSNFLRAIRFIRNYLLAGDNAAQAEGGWKRIWPNGQPHPLSLLITFTLRGYDDPFLYSILWAADDRGRVALQGESLYVGSTPVFAWKGNAWKVWPSDGPRPQTVEPKVHLGTFATSTEAVLAFAALTTGIGWHDFPATTLTEISSKPELLDARSKPVQWNGLSDNGANFLSVIRDMTQDLRDQRPRRQIRARLKQINSTVRSVELDSVQEPKRVVVGYELGGHKVSLDLSQESDGFRRYYAHLLALYQTPPKQVLMFEEPENGIYPGALRNLTEEFIEAPRAQRGQILLTTQSPELLDGFEPESFRVVDLDPQTQQTRIGPLDRDQLEAVRDRLLEPGELLTVDTPRIASAASPTGAANE